MTKTNFKWIGIAQLIVIVYSFVGVLSKTASSVLQKSGLFSMEFIFIVFTMFVALGVYAVVWQLILKHMDLSIAYANKGTNLIWTMIWSVLLFKESISLQNIVGTVLIILGILVVTRSE